MRSVSGFITPPGSRRASKSRACARSKATSTRTSLPHSPWREPRARSPLGDTTLVTAPALSSAERGSLSSDGSKPSVTRIATLTLARPSIVLLLGSNDLGLNATSEEQQWCHARSIQAVGVGAGGVRNNRRAGRYDWEEPDHRDHLHVRPRAQGFSTTLIQPS